MPRMFKLLYLPLAGFLILLGLFVLGLWNDPRLLPSALIDRPLPEFRAKTLTDPERIVSNNDLKGEIALLNVWATWCPTCYAEHKTLQALAAQGVIIYGVNYKDERDKALRWLNELGDPYRFNIDDEAGRLGLDLGVYGAPETYLLDKLGVIRYRHVGALDSDIWREVFLPRIRILEEKS